jgi:glyoxylase-like metal-dependent hydrolase (beta-lactamase superfamily II)
VWAHPLCAQRLGGVTCARTLEDGAIIDLGGAGLVRVVHTPGHTRDHLCLFAERSGSLLAGDMVSTVSTIIIDPPEGDLVDYLASLEKLQRLGARMLHPAHGQPTVRVSDTLRHFVEHRLFREEKTLAALAEEARGLGDLVKRVYDDVDAKVYPIAERNLLAGLLKLAREGRAECTADGAWRRAAR